MAVFSKVLIPLPLQWASGVVEISSVGKSIFLEIKAKIPVLNLNLRLGQDFPQKGKRTSTMKIIMSENFPFDVSLVPEFCFQEINKKKLTKRGRLRK